MQANNNLRVFSGSTNNIIPDDELATTPEVSEGAVNGSVASSKLYNTLSHVTTLATTALIDFIALNNPTITFGQNLSIDAWISAVQDTLVSQSQLDTAIQDFKDELTGGAEEVANAVNVTTNINGKPIANIFETNGTTAKSATNANNVTTNINGKAISTIFETNGTTVKNATNATNAVNSTNSTNTTLINDVSIQYIGDASSLRYTIKPPETSNRDILCVKQPLWIGEKTNSGTSTQTISLNTPVQLGDEIEVHWWTNNKGVSNKEMFKQRACITEFYNPSVSSGIPARSLPFSTNFLNIFSSSTNARIVALGAWMTNSTTLNFTCPLSRDGSSTVSLDVGVTITKVYRVGVEDR